jgi:hypothetical protein
MLHPTANQETGDDYKTTTGDMRVDREDRGEAQATPTPQDGTTTTETEQTNFGATT